MKRPIQYFTKDYLERCAEMTTDEIAEFLENFRLLTAEREEKCRLISLKIEPSLLAAFKAKAALTGIPYQALIKKLMRDWLNRG